MAKYIIDIPRRYEEGDYLHIPISCENSDTVWMPTNIKPIPYTEPDRKAIENEVWEFATTCTKMDGADSVDVFGGFSLDSFTKYSYQEAKAKYEAWRKQKEKIRVGDEVRYSLHGYDYNFIVFGIENDTLYGVRSDLDYGIDDIYNGWETCDRLESTLVKTGRHFDEVESLLKKVEVE